MRTWILLRGLARESGHWGDFVQQLQAALPHDRIVALDLPGTGHLNDRVSPLRVPAMVDAVRSMLDAQGIRPPVHLLGMSLGGMVAAAWVLSAPDEVAGCVLINSSLRPLSPLHQRLRPGAWWPLLRSLASADASASESLILYVTSNRPERRRHALAAWTALRLERPVSAGNALRQLWAAARFRVPAGRPGVPVLLLSGAGDRLVHPQCSRALAQHWQCTLSTHPSAGHDLALDAGDWVCAEIVRCFAVAEARR